MPEEVKKPSFYETLHNKSFREILAEREKEQKIEEPKEAIKSPELSPEDQTRKDAEDTKKQELQDQQRKDQEASLARKAAEDVVALQKEQEEKQLQELQKAEALKKQQEALKPAWQTDPNRAKDNNGNPLPKSYDEILEETKRIAKAEAMAEWEERERKRLIETEAKTTEEKAKQDEAKKVQEQFNEQLQKEIQTDLDDLYATDKMPKIVDPNNPNDPGLVEQKKLFETGMKVNKERLDKGLPPLRSIKLVYYEHYKPSQKPAGNSAPVAGNTPPAAVKSEGYNFVTDHKLSIGDYMRKLAKR